MAKDISQETIDQYLNKQLSGSALAEFEQLLQDDPNFKKEVETQALLYRAANKFGEDEMRGKLKSIRAEVLKEGLEQPAAKVATLKPRQKTRPILRWSIAASITVAISAAIYLVATWQNVSSDDLFASYYQPYSEEINVRNAPSASLASQAASAYQAKDYEAALPLFLQILEAEPDNAEVQIATGICQLELDRFEKATRTFSAVTNPLFKDQAQWYLAMTFLKQSDMENARTVLQSIESGDFNYTKAKEILEQL